MKFSLFTALLFSMLWSYEVTAQSRPKNCCLKTTNTRINVSNIVSYVIQGSPPCPIRAIRFNTKKSRTICSDPNDKWAQGVIEKLDGTTPIQKSTKCPTTSTDLTPHTTTEPPVRETETTGSTTGPTTERITTSGQKTSTSTTVSTTEITIKTSGQKTSESTTVLTTETTFKTPGQTSSMSTAQLTTVTMNKIPDPKSSLNTETTCGTGEPTPPAESPSTVASTTPAKRTKPITDKNENSKKEEQEST